jgi:hypothetical protein
MRAIGNCLSDPSLHLLAIALLLVYLAFGGGSWSRDSSAETPLPYCQNCHFHFLPGKPCDCVLSRKLANATP